VDGREGERASGRSREIDRASAPTDTWNCPQRLRRFSPSALSACSHSLRLRAILLVPPQHLSPLTTTSPFFSFPPQHLPPLITTSPFFSFPPQHLPTHYDFAILLVSPSASPSTHNDFVPFAHSPPLAHTLALVQTPTKPQVSLGPLRVSFIVESSLFVHSSR